MAAFTFLVTYPRQGQRERDLDILLTGVNNNIEANSSIEACIIYQFVLWASNIWVLFKTPTLFDLETLMTFKTFLRNNTNMKGGI